MRANFQIGDRVVILGNYKATIVDTDPTRGSVRAALDIPLTGADSNSIATLWLWQETLELMSPLKQLGEVAE